MSTTVKTGWLHDKNGDKFAPKTLTSQVQTNDGILIEDKIQTDLESVKTYINTKLSELPDPVVNPASASVGQTIVVKEVDENGKPVKWESADYQPRTHWDEEVEILPETTVEIDLEMGGAELPYDFTLEAGKEYTVIYNGVEYTGVECISGSEGSLVLGNGGAIEESLPATGHPFILVYEPFTEDENGNPIFAWAVIPLDGSTSVALSINESKTVTIPPKYLPRGIGYDTEKVILPQTTVEIDSEQGFGLIDVVLNMISGQFYNITYNGVEYSLECFPLYDEVGGFVLGNMGMTMEPPIDNGIPFIFTYRVLDWDENGDPIGRTIIMPVDGSTSVTLSIKESKPVTIPPKYLPEGIGYDEEKVILPETTAEVDAEMSTAVFQDFLLEGGKKYTVIYNGVKYTGVECIDTGNMLALGNLGAMDESYCLLTEHPFILAREAHAEDENGNPIFGWACAPLDGSTSVTLSVKESKPVKIPHKYLPDGIGYEEDVYILPKTTLMDTEAVFITTLSQPLVVGETYKITYNSSEYSCEARDSFALVGEPGAVMLGNIDLVMGTGDTGEPFVAVYDTTSDFPQISFNDVNGVGIITVSISQSQVRTIPPKYLPDGVPFDESVVLVPETTPTTIVEDNSYVLFIASDVKFIPNETYEIMYAGLKYVCTAMVDASGTFVGNGAMMGGENTGEPFLMGTSFDKIVPPFDESGIVVFPLYDSAPLPTVSITKGKVQKISARCLPEGVGYEHVEVIIPKSSPVLEDQTLFLYCDGYLELGETYTVTFNNDEYKCTTKLFSNTEMIMLGNSSIYASTFGENTGEPFLIIQVENDIGNPAAALFLDSNLNLTELPTVSITKNTVHKIPAKYLPDNIGSGSVLPLVTTADNGSILRVVDGAWAVSHILNVEEGEF